ncbi:MAG: DNA/RNA helicase domain-containing protein [Verrucomicrobiales bacterium]
MIVYLATKAAFVDDVVADRIQERIENAFQTTLKRNVSPAEATSWRNSMMYMRNVLDDGGIPDDTGVAVEFNIPQTSKRIDVILTGRDSEMNRSAVIVELKQWQKVMATDKDAIVRTFLGGGEREVGHPSYQAWSYAALLEDFNEAVRTEPVRLKPCAFLHNCDPGSPVVDAFYAEHLERAPVFLRTDALKLREFIRQHVRHGDGGETMYRIQAGRIRPSKSLADALTSLLKGNREFVMIDDQKVVFETALQLAKKATAGTKQVLIVDGGPGTGKSVVAINLLVALTGQGRVAKYVTKNAAPRTVYESKLTGTFSRSRISNLFGSSGSYIETLPDTFDALIVDEAHRLNAKTGMFQKGENQIKELMRASRCSVFFIDEDQRVTFSDIGSKEEIRSWALASGAEVTELALESQFRCNGSDGYLAWVDDVLQIRKTANPTLEGVNYEVRVSDTPGELRERIIQLNNVNNKARLVAGYCWNWSGKKFPDKVDIVMPEHGFSARWNLASDGNLWILKPESVQEIGCVHTCQGLELDYVGVLIGPDLVVRNGVVVCQPEKRARTDASLKGYKALLKQAPVAAREKAVQRQLKIPSATIKTDP